MMPGFDVIRRHSGMAVLLLSCMALAAAQDVSRTYKESEAVFPNPERGLFQATNFLKATDFGDQAARGNRIVHGLVHLEAFRAAPLSGDFLDSLSQRLVAVRKTGMKVLL